MTDGSSDDDWVSETLARAMLEGDDPRSDPGGPQVPSGLRPASADVGPLVEHRRELPGDVEDHRVERHEAPLGEPSLHEPPLGDPSLHETPLGDPSLHEPPLGEPWPRERPEPGRRDPGAPASLGAARTEGAGEVPPDDGARSEDDGDLDRRHSALRSAVEWVVVIVGALAAALLLRALLFQAFWIPSESMEPTLQRDDRVLVNRLSYRLHDVNRGDVVVFGRPPGEPEGPIHDLIKRVVALSGETVEGRGGQIYVDGQLLVEPYLVSGDGVGDFGPVTVPEGHVFVMGDNRNNSRDSRFFGPIAEDTIVGRAFVLFWPVDRAGLL